jgi:hypothetical protein
MEPDPSSLLHRIRWGNVAWALAALAAVGLVLAWPHLQRRGPGLPDETESVSSAPVPQPVPPAPPVSSARPRVPQSPPRQVAPARPSRRPRGPRRPHARHAPRPHRRARSAPPPTALGRGVSAAPKDTGPAPPAGDQEFLPG